MFDVGFWEIALIGLITLLVVGPERLPSIARQAGRYMNKVRRFLTDVKTQVNSELHSDEITNLKSHLSLEDEKNSILEVVSDIQTDVELLNKPKKDNANPPNNG